jgi:hypothetical protein
MIKILQIAQSVSAKYYFSGLVDKQQVTEQLTGQHNPHKPARSYTHYTHSEIWDQIQ